LILINVNRGRSLGKPQTGLAQGRPSPDIGLGKFVGGLANLRRVNSGFGYKPDLRATADMLIPGCLVSSALHRCNDFNGALKGVDAVIDKGLATSLLARLLRADMMIITTAIERWL
jgi:hypothetical protein